MLLIFARVASSTLPTDEMLMLRDILEEQPNATVLQLTDIYAVYADDARFAMDLAEALRYRGPSAACHRAASSSG